MVLPAISQRGLFALLYPNFFILSFLFGLICLVFRFLLPGIWLRVLAGLKAPQWQLTAVGVLGVLYGAIGWLVLRFPGYVDPVEPMVVAASFFAVHGRPVYDMVISYGPLCFLPYGAAMNLFGASVGVLKCVIALANVAFVVLLFLVFRKTFESAAALFATALVLSCCLMKQDYLFQARGDLFIYVAVALALLAAVTTGETTAAILMIAAIALGCGVKVTAALYLAYPVTLLWKAHGTKLLLFVGAASVALSLLPFALSTLVIADYLHWLSVMSHQPRSAREFVGNIVTTVLLAAPCLLSYWALHLRDPQAGRRYLRSNWLSLTLLAFSVFAMDVLASKIGAGRHHLIPFFVFTAYVCSQMIEARPPALVGSSRPHFLPVYLWGSLALLLMITEVSELRDVRALTALEAPQAKALSNDVAWILASYPGHKVELGDGFGEFDLERTYSPMFAAPQLVFAGGFYSFDPSAQADIEMVHAPMRDSDLHHVTSCESSVWLIPRGQAPFHSVSIYSGMYPDRYDGRLLFPPFFEKLFLDTYELTASSHFFDIYTCKRG